MQCSLRYSVQVFVTPEKPIINKLNWHLYDWTRPLKNNDTSSILYTGSLYSSRQPDRLEMAYSSSNRRNIRGLARRPTYKCKKVKFISIYTQPNTEAKISLTWMLIILRETVWFSQVLHVHNSQRLCLTITTNIQWSGLSWSSGTWNKKLSTSYCILQSNICDNLWNQCIEELCKVYGRNLKCNILPIPRYEKSCLLFFGKLIIK